ncbi:MAG TPA: PRC-barrel domain-containing protein [Chloroflexota bacterium]
MKVPEPENEQPLAWSAVLEETAVYSSDGEEVGVVNEMLGSEDEDIFHGVVVRSGLTGNDVMVPADQVKDITNRRIDIALTAEEVRALSPYQEEDSYRLGFVGLFRRRLGWVRDGRDPE